MKRYLFFLLLLLMGRADAAETMLYNGETAKFSTSSAWDQNNSTLAGSTVFPYSKPNHLRAVINVKNWWGAAAYVPANWNVVDMSKATSLSLAIRSPQAKSISVSLYDSNKATSNRVNVVLTTAYKVMTLPMSGFTGVDLSKIQAIVFSASVGTTTTYKVDIDDIKLVMSDCPPCPQPTPCPTPTPTPTPTPIPDTADVKTKAANLVKEISGKNYVLVGEGGIDAKALGIKPAIHYRYLVGGWRSWNSPDGEYANMVMAQAKEVGAIPMFTYYWLAYQFEIKNYSVLSSSDLHQYLLDLRVMYQKLGAYSDYTLVHLEPDFFGYLQQYAVSIKTNAADIPAKVRYSDIPECSALPENVGGLLSCMVKMGRVLSPKTRIGFHASAWGDWCDWNDPNAPIVEKSASVGNFLRSVGADQTDFIVLETTDRDAGFLEATRGATKAYWDETNATLPNFTTHFKFAKTVGQTMLKPVLWWQMPFGVPSTTPGGTEGHYRDNRVRYFFSHMNEVVDAGGFGVVYGAGADRQTTPSTDGGQFKTALENYLTSPTNLTP